MPTLSIRLMLVVSVSLLASCGESVSRFSGDSSNGYPLTGTANSLVGPDAGKVSIAPQSGNWRCDSTRPWSFGATNETIPLACTDQRRGEVQMIQTGPSAGIMLMRLSDGEYGRLAGGNAAGQALARSVPTWEQVRSQLGQSQSGRQGSQNCRSFETTCYRNMPDYQQCMAQPICEKQ